MNISKKEPAFVAGSFFYTPISLDIIRKMRYNKR